MRLCRLPILIFFAFTCTAPIGAEETLAYPCKLQGKTVYSQTACADPSIKPIKIKASHPSAEQVELSQKENAKRAKETGKLLAIRHRAEAKDEAKRLSAAKHYAARKHQCDSQKLRLKWAKEDAGSTSPRSQAKANNKQRRAQEKTDFYCKSL